MRSSERVALAAFLLVSSVASRARAQTRVQGFAVERLYASPAGAGWIVMDDLSMHGRLGGALSLTGGYEHDTLRVATSDGSTHFAPIVGMSTAAIGLAGTYDRFRLSIEINRQLASTGDTGPTGNGIVGAYKLTPPSVSLATDPDTIADTRVGLAARLVGDYKDAFRLGVGVQLVVPSGDRSDYDTDGTYRGMGRLLFAGDVPHFEYAGQLGVHIRPLNDSPAPGSPQGSEMLFGIAGGAKVPVGHDLLVVGPEIFGETAFNSFLSTTGTGLEALLSTRLEEQGETGPQLRLKLGAGGGLNPHFGAPEWRAVFAIELFDRAHHRVDHPAAK
jgi:hypothetical protein